jgi:bacillithiol biosynthesis cysteine-adding enzyme BshC
MEARCLPFSSIPHTTRLFADYNADFARVKDFYPLSPQDFAGLQRRASGLDYSPDLRAAVADVLERQNRQFDSSAETMKNIERLRRGSSAMVTGQQVVLLGGPVFSIYKALTVIKRAKQMTEAGVDCVPIFWLATEDHDFAEVAHCVLRTANGTPHPVSITGTAPEGTPVGKIAIGEPGARAIGEAAKLLPESPHRDWLIESYQPQETLGSAFGKLFARIFAEQGLILLDPADAALHQLSASVYREAIAHCGEIVDALLERGRALERAGYHEQVKVTNSTTPLFADKDGIRTPVRRDGGDFLVGEERCSVEQLDVCIAQHPEKFSPNVLLRPVIQDFLLPTVAYFGGPAEVAYFAQVAVVYEKLLGKVTPILPRFSATLLDARTQRHLQHYKIAPQECFTSEQELRELLAAKALPAEIETIFSQSEKELNVLIERVTETVTRLDATLREAAEHSGSKMRHQLQQLVGRAARAQAMRNAEVTRHAGVLAGTLYPDQKLQEREIAGISFLAQFGAEALSRIGDQMDLSCSGHCFLPM